MTEIYRISTLITTGDIRVSNGVVISASYGYQRFIGRLLVNVAEWVRTHGYTMELIESPGSDGPQK